MSLGVSTLLRTRHPDPAACVALFVTGGVVMTTVATVLWRRHGHPAHWPTVERLGCAGVAAACCLGWWWVDASVEGRVVVTLAATHGVTTADLLALPALAWAGYLCRPR